MGQVIGIPGLKRKAERETHDNPSKKARVTRVTFSNNIEMAQAAVADRTTSSEWHRWKTCERCKEQMNCEMDLYKAIEMETHPGSRLNTAFVYDMPESLIQEAGPKLQTHKNLMKTLNMRMERAGQCYFHEWKNRPSYLQQVKRAFPSLETQVREKISNHSSAEVPTSSELKVNLDEMLDVRENTISDDEIKGKEENIDSNMEMNPDQDTPIHEKIISTDKEAQNKDDINSNTEPNTSLEKPVNLHTEFETPEGNKKKSDQEILEKGMGTILDSE